MLFTNQIDGFVEYAKRCGCDSSSVLSGILALSSLYHITISIDSRKHGINHENYDSLRNRLSNAMENCHTLLYYVDRDDLDGSCYGQFLSILDCFHDSLDELASECIYAESAMMLTALSQYRSAVLIAGNIINERKIMEHLADKEKIPYPTGYVHIEALIYHIDELINYVRREKMK